MPLSYGGLALSSRALTVVALLAGCTTAWEETGLFYRSVQTALAVDSTPVAARAYLDNRPLGDTPLSAMLDCEQEVRKKTRKVSYWVTQPGWALLLSIASLGLYVPFSMIPVDPESSQEPTSTFRNNEFVLRIEADEYRTWTTEVVCGTEPRISIRAVLEKP